MTVLDSKMIVDFSKINYQKRLAILYCGCNLSTKSSICFECKSIFLKVVKDQQLTEIFMKYILNISNAEKSGISVSVINIFINNMAKSLKKIVSVFLNDVPM